MVFRDFALPEEYRQRMHLAQYDARFVKKRGDDCYGWTGNGSRSGKVLAIYAALAEDGDDAIDILREVENMLCAHLWMAQEGLV